MLQLHFRACTCTLLRISMNTWLTSQWSCWFACIQCTKSSVPRTNAHCCQMYKQLPCHLAFRSTAACCRMHPVGFCETIRVLTNSSTVPRLLFGARSWSAQPPCTASSDGGESSISPPFTRSQLGATNQLYCLHFLCDSSKALTPWS